MYIEPCYLKKNQVAILGKDWYYQVIHQPTKKEIIVLKDSKPGSARFENSPIPYMIKMINKLKLTRPKKNDNYIKL